MNKLIKITSLATIGLVISKAIKFNTTKYWKDDYQYKVCWITVCGKRVFTMHFPTHHHFKNIIHN